MGAVAMFLTFIFTMSTSPYSPRVRQATVELGGQEFHIDIADTPALAKRGLGGRRSLGENEGMIFFFSSPARYIFWMKDMLIPIDIIWVRNHRVVGVVADAKPPSPATPDEALERFQAPEAADTVIEIQAGSAAKLGVRNGQEVRIVVP